MSLSTRFPPNVLPPSSLSIPSFNTLAQLIRPSNAPAIIIPDSDTTLSYHDFQSNINIMRHYLCNSINNFQPSTSICLSLVNNVEFCIAFFAIVSIRGIAAPPNPSYTVEENKFYMDDIQAKAMIVPIGEGKQAREAAKQAGAMIIEVGFDNASKRIIIKDQNNNNNNASPSMKVLPVSLPSDPCLVLHTSGTTSRPKAVPLSHANLCSSIKNIIGTLYLTSNDRSMIAMPLFHVHGLIGALLSSFAVSSSVVLPPKFSARSFWQHFHRYSCTWYSAVPTIHQILIELERKESSADKRGKLRMIRSCSASLAPSTYEELNKIFSVPIVEAYAMTEASHQMTCNPLPPPSGHSSVAASIRNLPRKPGSVGLAHGGVQIAILNSDDKELSANQRGEVCVKGPNVTAGYINNEEANRSSFTAKERWFRTGDEGYLDEQGYLFLTGRIKELINRGGEKISPLEVDAALLSSPLVAQAVSFPAPDKKYGQEVVAAVVLRQPLPTDPAVLSQLERDLQSYCKTKISAFKIPKKIYFAQDVPRTATGKIQRRHVASHFLSLPSKL